MKPDKTKEYAKKGMMRIGDDELPNDQSGLVNKTWVPVGKKDTSKTKEIKDDNGNNKS